MEQAVSTTRLPLSLVLDMSPYVLPQSLILLYRLLICEFPYKLWDPGREVIISSPLVEVVV